MPFVLIGVIFSLLIEICHLFRFCSLSTVIHNPHKIWSENVAFDNIFSTKKSLKLYLNLSWFKLYTISPKKPAIHSSRYLQSMERQLQAAILKGHLGLSARLKTSSLNFPFSWLAFVIGFNNKLYNLFFSFSCLSCDFHQNNGRKQGIDIFSTGNAPWYIIIAISFSWLVLVIGFRSVITVLIQFLFPSTCLFMWFSSKNGKKQVIAIFSTVTHHGRLLKNLSEKLPQILKR